jgi:hypothetical protein
MTFQDGSNRIAPWSIRKSRSDIRITRCRRYLARYAGCEQVECGRPQRTAQPQSDEPWRASLPTRLVRSKRCTPMSRPVKRTALRELVRRLASPSSERNVSAISSPIPNWVISAWQLGWWRASHRSSRSSLWTCRSSVSAINNATVIRSCASRALHEAAPSATRPRSPHCAHHHALRGSTRPTPARH